jgi:hypothetical protein
VQLLIRNFHDKTENVYGDFAKGLYFLGYPNSLIPFQSETEILRCFTAAGKSIACLRQHAKCPILSPNFNHIWKSFQYYISGKSVQRSGGDMWMKIWKHTTQLTDGFLRSNSSGGSNNKTTKTTTLYTNTYKRFPRAPRLKLVIYLSSEKRLQQDL